MRALHAKLRNRTCQAFKDWTCKEKDKDQAYKDQGKGKD